MGRVIGIDYGTKRFGLALSDTGRTLASPVAVLHGEAALRRELDRLIETEEVDRVVVGLPLNMDGSVGRKAKEVLAFRDRLARSLELPVDTYDERLTTVQAEDLLREAGFSFHQRAERIDKVAAQILLQSYLDRAAGATAAEPDAGSDAT